jgi:hypothetical protein
MEAANKSGLVWDFAKHMRLPPLELPASYITRPRVMDRLCQISWTIAAYDAHRGNDEHVSEFDVTVEAVGLSRSFVSTIRKTANATLHDGGMALAHTETPQNGFRALVLTGTAAVSAPAPIHDDGPDDTRQPDSARC